MPNWLTISLALLFFFVTTFLFTWAVRDGGSFAFLTPSYWKPKPGPSRRRQDEPGRHR